MSWIENTLNQIEARLRAMIEGEGGRDGIPRKFYSQLMHALVEAMSVEAQNHFIGNGLQVRLDSLPDQYTLVLPPKQAQLLLDHPAALDQLARKLELSATQLDVRLAAPPMLRVVADPKALELQVYCTNTQPGKGDSLTVELAGQSSSSAMINMPEAFLIVNGLSTFRLSAIVTNIGSDPGNQLVLSNPRVSRKHAQLRLSAGHFVIFDLDSREGTFVNGVAVSNRMLNPGDVIMLAGVPLVYGEETIAHMERTQQLPAEPQPPEVV